MNIGLYKILSGNGAQEKRLEIISNNLSNLNTSGFKKDKIRFEAVLSKAKTSLRGKNNPEYMVKSKMYTDFESGALKKTDGDLDLAIDGDGFFVIGTPTGNMFTRDGKFKIGNNGTVTTLAGDSLLGEGNTPIRSSDGNQITFSSEGEVFITQENESGGKEKIKIAKLNIVEFKDKGDLIKSANGLFFNKNPKGIFSVKNVSIKQGFLEGANVNSITEMVEMISVSRGVESYQKVISSFDDMQKTLIENVGRV